MIRGHAAWSLARGFGAASRDILQHALSVETVEEALRELEIALKMIDDPEEYEAMVLADETNRMVEPGRGN